MGKMDDGWLSVAVLDEAPPGVQLHRAGLSSASTLFAWPAKSRQCHA